MAASRRNKRRESRPEKDKAWKGEEGDPTHDRSLSTITGVHSDQKHAETVDDHTSAEKASIPRDGEAESSTVPIAAFAATHESGKETSSIATARPSSRQSRMSPIPTLKPSNSALNRQRSGTSTVGPHVSALGPIGRSNSAAGADNSSIASSGPISPSDAEDLAVAFRQAMRKAGDQ